MVAAAAHSLLGASGASRWLRCPGSFRLMEHAPSAAPSIHAATGTLAHDWIERLLKHPNDRTRLRAGDTYQIEGHTIAVDDDFMDGVDTMLTYVRQVSRDYDLMAVEQRVSLDGYFSHRAPPPVPLFGRVDVALASPRMVEIVDYKNGTGVIVDPTDNPQTLYYAAGAVWALQRRRPPIVPAKIRTTIVQPHARSVAKVRSATIDYLDLMFWVDDVLIPGVEACAAPDAPLVPGPWCRFCPVSLACPALLAEANRMAKIEFDDDRVRVEDDAELSELLDTAAKARAWCDAIERYALEELKRQRRVPNWGLEPTRPVRRWRDDATTVRVLNGMNVPDEDIYKPTEVRSPAQIEKLVRRRVSPAVWDAQLAPLVESVSSGVKLHRERMPAAEDFDPC